MVLAFSLPPGIFRLLQTQQSFHYIKLQKKIEENQAEIHGSRHVGKVNAERNIKEIIWLAGPKITRQSK